MSRFKHFEFPSQDFLNWVDTELSQSAKSCSNDATFISLLTLMEKRLGATSVLCESNYIDADFQSLSSCWYSKSFKQLPNLCCRVHFAREELSKQTLLNNEFQDTSYLGYAVLTPLNTGRVGRTVVSPWVNTVQSNGDTCFPVFLSAPSTVHIYGRRLVACGAPFISQDAMVMVCAQAAIWMALNYMHFKHGSNGLKRVLPDQITTAATDGLTWAGRLLPSGGLTAEHIANALSNLGHPSIVDTRREDAFDWKPLNWILKYIDSNIPIILALWHPPHAVVVVGALLGCNNYSDISTDDQITSLDNWIGGLIINDDNLGPYKIMPCDEGQLTHLRTEYSDLLPVSGTWESIDHISALFIPLPQEVSIQARHIDVILKQQVFRIRGQNRILSRLLEQADETSRPVLFRFMLTLLGHVDNDRIVTRSYLIPSMEYLQAINNKGEYPKALVSFYKKQQFPTYIWVSELYLQSDIQSQNVPERRALGEVILDASANKYDPSWLFVHVGGLILYRDVSNEEISFTFIENVQQYLTCKADPTGA